MRCAGCGDTLEVERGLTEFACPSCATPQALPPELMPPPPPRPRRALPLGLSAAPARVPCGGCGAVLAVPRGIRRLLACPLCGAEIDVDGRERFAAYSGVQVISPPGTVVLAPTSSRLLEVPLLEPFELHLPRIGVDANEQILKCICQRLKMFQLQNRNFCCNSSKCLVTKDCVSYLRNFLRPTSIYWDDCCH